MSPAGLPRRYAAWSLDATLLGLLATALCADRVRLGLTRCASALAELSDAMAAMMLEGLRHDGSIARLLAAGLADPALRVGALELAAAIGATLGPPVLAFAVLGLPWHAGFEASRWQATPGKRILGLRVVDDVDGGRLTLPRAVLRQVAGVLSWISLNLGHLMAALPPRQRALHDVVAGARVVQADVGASLPPWARYWLAAQVMAAIAAMAWLLQVVDAAMQASLDRLL